MQKSEWDQIVGLMAATWPNFPPTDASIDKFFLSLEAYPAAQVHAAIETYNRDGERYPPNDGQILARIAELTHDDPDHGEAWGLLNKVRWKYGIYGGEDGRRGDKVALAELHELSPATAEVAREIGWMEICMMPTDQEGTLRAQFRDMYRNAANRRRRAKAFEGLPSADLPALERGSKPRKFHAGAIASTVKQLPEGST